MTNMFLTTFATGAELKALEEAAQNVPALAGLVERASAALAYVKAHDEYMAARAAWDAEVAETGEERGPAWDALQNPATACEAARVAYVGYFESMETDTNFSFQGVGA